MANYGVTIVADDALPCGVEWMFIKTTEGDLLFCLAQSSSGCARALAEAWSAYRAIAAQTNISAERDLVSA